MDPADCHVVYVDKRASRERFEKKPSIASSFDTSSAGYGQEIRGVKENLDAILAVFDGGTYAVHLFHHVSCGGFLLAAFHG